MVKAVEPRRHQGEQFSAQVRDTARRLLLVDRLSSSRAEQRLSTMFPDESVPSDQTLRLWRSQMAEIGEEERAIIEQNEREIILAGDDLILDALHLVKQSGSMGALWSLKNMIALNAITGTPRDKQLKRQQLAQPQTVPGSTGNVLVQIILPGLTPPSTDLSTIDAQPQP